MLVFVCWIGRERCGEGFSDIPFRSEGSDSQTLCAVSSTHEDERTIGLLLRHVLNSVLIPRRRVLMEMGLDFRKVKITTTNARGGSAVRQNNNRPTSPRSIGRPKVIGATQQGRLSHREHAMFNPTHFWVCGPPSSCFSILELVYVCCLWMSSCRTEFLSIWRCW